MGENITNNQEETIALGKKFSQGLSGGEVILLIGDLGAGKTTFVKGAAEGLGVEKVITSPTFVIMKVYQTKKHENIKSLVHIDTYRGMDAIELENIGAMEYFGRKDCVCFVEWGAGLEDYLKKRKIKTVKIEFGSLSENKRQINNE